jgi:phospholipase D-like protein
MILGEGALGLILLGVWLFCIIDVITTPDGAQRNLPKLVWLLIVVLLSDVGSIAWLVAGRPWNTARELPSKTNRGSGGSRAGAPAARGRASNPDDDEEFLASLRARADEQRRRARDAKGDEPTGAAE